MNTEEYRKHLYNPKTDKYELLRHLKREGDIDKIRKIIRNISSHSFIKHILKSNVAPNEYADIRKQKAIPFSGNFIGEAAIYLVTFEENKSIINDFIKKKNEFEREFLLGNYETAETLLNSIEAVTGKSFWLIENQILLKEHRDGVKSNWNEVSELSEKVKDPIVLFFIENLSKRAEVKISYFRYLNIFNNHVAELQLHHPLLYEYLCFRLNHSAFTGYENLDFLLYAESTSSLVDRYLLFKDILSEMLSTQFKKQTEDLKLLVTKLFELFSTDIQLCQILSLHTPDYVQRLPTNNQVNALIKEYTFGNYNYCIENASKAILELPTIIEVYEIYVKSLIEQRKEESFELYPNNIKNILVTLYKIYSSQSNIEQTVDLGLKICTSFSSTNWSKQFLSLIQSSTSTNNGNKLFTIQYIINSQLQNPRILYYSKKENIEEYCIYLKSNIEIVESTDTINNIVKGNYTAIQADNNLSQNKRDLYFGRALIRASKFQEAKDHFELLSQNEYPSTLYEEELIVNLFRCYIKLNLSIEACKLFVKQYLKNKETTKRLNKQKLLEVLENGQLEMLGRLIELPIFYRIASNDSYQQYVAYDTYIESYSVTRPTDLIKNLTAFDAEQIFFLREVCSIEIMHHSYHFNGTDDIEKERLEILNKLIVIDNSNEDIYIKEITELNQNSNIRRAIREVNQGRISVNVQQLRNNEASNIKEAFNRYKEIETYSKTKEILGIDVSANMLNELANINVEELLGNKIVYINDPAFISFKVIFIEIRDKFLLSKEYGLDGYLSTRIRHGTLLNHIRSTFESQNIISQRDKDNIYLDNSYWHNRIPYNLQDKKEQIQEAIKKFSKSIDEYTEFIIKELIQVRTEKHSKKINALFDFSISNAELAILFAAARQNIKDHNFFLSFVFDYLQRNTERILTRIREIINTDIKDKYNSLLQDFNTQIKEIIGNNTFPELTSAIGLCGTSIQNELKNISEWFYLSNTSKDLTLDLKVLIQTAIQITNTISPNSKLNPRISEDHPIPIVGTIHLIYVCRILLDNIINHSKVSPNELDIEISTKVTDDNFLEISFRNNLSNSIDKVALNEKLLKVKNKWDLSSNDFENIDVEGGSGFEKIRRIIAFDLECEFYKFDFKLEGDFLTIILSIEFLNLPTYEEN